MSDQAPVEQKAPDPPWDRGMTFRTLRMVHFALYRTVTYAVVTLTFWYTPWIWMRWLCGIVAVMHLIDTWFSAVHHGRRSAPQPPPQFVAHLDGAVLFHGKDAEALEALTQQMIAKQHGTRSDLQ